MRGSRGRTSRNILKKYMIKTLSELIEDYNNGQMPSEEIDGFIPFYPTEEHKRQDSVGYMPIQELSKWAKLSKDIENQKFKNLWK